MAPESKKVVLVVDDEADFAFIVQKNLKQEGFVAIRLFRLLDLVLNVFS